ncbi:hypothetical protein R80B4_02848 [Fibrobacteres bacterium R8-0-B4]
MQTTVNRVKVCVPYNNQGAIHHRCQASLDALLKYSETHPGLKVEVLKIQGCLIAHNRNFGVSGADSRVKQNNFPFDYYLAIDADVVFKPEDVIQLINQDKDIIGGAYAYRPDPTRIVAGHFNDSNKFDGDLSAKNFLPNTTKGLLEVDFLGAGFLLIKAKVFETLEYPYFREELIHQTNANGETCVSVCGEDVGFFLQAKRTGIKAYIDCDCKVEHILETTEFMPSDVLTWAYRRREQLQQELQQTNNQINELNIISQRIVGGIALIDEELQIYSQSVQTPQTVS